MARIIFISPYLQGGKDTSKLANRTRYVATRDGVEKLFDRRENFIDYVAHRPGVQKEGDHGLWNSGGKVADLGAAVKEVSTHQGIVWTPVVALRREDAVRLGYDNAANWRALVNSLQNEIARNYHIQPKNLRWYAAFHEKENQVHIHMTIFSTDPNEGYLSKAGIRDMKAAFAKRIYRQEMMHVYEQKHAQREMVQEHAAEKMAALLYQMEQGGLRNEKLEQMILELADKLQTTKGKKVYGYLPPKVKALVDDIVEELAKDERVAQAYDIWNQLREETCKVYSEKVPPRMPLSQQEDFKPVRNMVIQEVLNMSQTQSSNPAPEITYVPKERQTSAASAKPKNTPAPKPPAPTDAAAAVARMFHHMGRIFADNCKQDAVYRGIQMDRKRRRQLHEQRAGLGHRMDDHEDEQMKRY